MPSRSRPILTPAQWLVLERLARGESNAAIARALGVGRPTVQSHLGAIYQRLPLAREANRRAAAVAWYLREGRQRRQEEEGN